MKRVQPDYYTKKEGGEWIRWVDGQVELPQSDQKLNFVDIRGHRVHSFAFGEVAAGLGHFKRWDVKNGFNQWYGGREVL